MVSTLNYIWVLAQMLAELFDFCTICIYTILLCTFFVLNTLQRDKYGTQLYLLRESTSDFFCNDRNRFFELHKWEWASG